MIKYGLKLWSNNERYMEQAEKLYNEKAHDYIELYIVPGTYDKYIEMWRNLKIPCIIHCTHSMHGFNLAIKDEHQNNLRMFSEVRAFCDKLDGKYIIVHPGIGGSMENTIEQINAMNDRRLLIENMPYVSMFGDDCIGSVYEELKTIVDSCNIGFCMDVAHAIITAFHLELNNFEYMKKMLNLAPEVIHISDGRKQKHASHLNIGDGDFDFEEIKKITALSNAEYITLELPKGNDWIHSFTEGSKKIKNYE